MLPFDARRHPSSYVIDGKFYTNPELLGKGKGLYDSVARIFSPYSEHAFATTLDTVGELPGFKTEIAEAFFIPQPKDIIHVAPPHHVPLPASPLYLFSGGERELFLTLSLTQRQEDYCFVPDPIMDRWRERLDESISIKMQIPGKAPVWAALSPRGNLTQPPPSYGPGKKRGDIDRIATNALKETYSLFRVVGNLIDEGRLQQLPE